MDAATIAPPTLYTYHCVDGCVRTRCEQHIERSGPYAMLQRDEALYRRRPTQGRCVRCEWEERQATRKRKEDKETV